MPSYPFTFDAVNSTLLTVSTSIHSTLMYPDIVMTRVINYFIPLATVLPLILMTSVAIYPDTVVVAVNSSVGISINFFGPPSLSLSLSF